MIYIRWSKNSGDEEVLEVYDEGKIAVRRWSELRELDLHSLTMYQPSNDDEEEDYENYLENYLDQGGKQNA